MEVTVKIPGLDWRARAKSRGVACGVKRTGDSGTAASGTTVSAPQARLLRDSAWLDSLATVFRKISPPAPENSHARLDLIRTTPERILDREFGRSFSPALASSAARVPRCSSMIFSGFFGPRIQLCFFDAHYNHRIQQAKATATLCPPRFAHW